MAWGEGGADGRPSDGAAVGLGYASGCFRRFPRGIPQGEGWQLLRTGGSGAALIGKRFVKLLERTRLIWELLASLEVCLHDAEDGGK